LGAGDEEKDMALADVTVNFTLSNLAILIIAGLLVGLVTGQLMKSKGFKAVALDLLFGFLGMLIGVYAVGPLVDIGRFGFSGNVLMAVVGSLVVVVLEHFLLTARRKAAA
jgi:uncharacterized membrane protein YeaQ/YmgE (transglycosylase-associated protein family)